MSRAQLSQEVMRYFEDALDVLRSEPGKPVDLAVLASVVLEVGEAICLQFEITRSDLLARSTDALNRSACQ